MSARSIGTALFGNRKRPGDADYPTDPVRRGSWHVDDPRAKPGKKIGDGSSRCGLAFRNAMMETIEWQIRRQFKEGKPADELPRLSRQVIGTFRALWEGLTYRTGEWHMGYRQIADIMGAGLSTAKRGVLILEEWGIVCHQRRKRDRTDSDPAGPNYFAAPNTYYLDLRRRMPKEMFEEFWRRFKINCGNLKIAAQHAWHLLLAACNEDVKPAPRPKQGVLDQMLDSIRRHLWQNESPFPECQKTTDTPAFKPYPESP